MSTNSSTAPERGSSPLVVILSWVALGLFVMAVVAVSLTIMGYNRDSRLTRVWDALRDAPVAITATPSSDDLATATSYAVLVRAATAAAVPTAAVARVVTVEVTAQPAPAQSGEATPAPLVPIPTSAPPEGVNVALHIGGDGISLAGSVGSRQPQNAPDDAQQAQAVVESIQRPVAQPIPDVARCIAGSVFNPSWCDATPTPTTPPAGSPYRGAPNIANSPTPRPDPFGLK